jgi:hypothetical protein
LLKLPAQLNLVSVYIQNTSEKRQRGVF